jgi:hypothetical protein
MSNKTDPLLSCLTAVINSLIDWYLFSEGRTHSFQARSQDLALMQ